MELEPYTESRRDLIEDRLTAERHKRELIAERRHDLSIKVHWLKLTNQVSMSLEADGMGREFLIPNNRVLDARDHPEAYAARAGQPRILPNDWES